MLLRKCGDSGHGARSTERWRRRRQRGDLVRVIGWPDGRGVADSGPGEPEVTDSITTRPFDNREVRPGSRIADGPPGPSDGLTWLWQLLGQTPTARDQWTELLRLATTSADRPVRAETLNAVGRFACAAGDLRTAQAFYQEALVAGRADRNAAGVARSLDGLTQMAAARGAFDLARTLQEESLLTYRRAGDTAGLARSLAVLGWLTLEQRGTTQAEALQEESLTLRVSLDAPLALAYSLVHLGWLAHLRGDRETAREYLAEALTSVRTCPDRWKVVSLLALLGRPSGHETPTRQAAGLLIGAEMLEASAAIQTERAFDPFGYLTEAQRHLDARSLAVAWGGGREDDAERLVEQALRASELLPTPQRNGVVAAIEPMLLTPRELEVAMLIGRGYTNRRIAEVLVIAERTAETHARNIREKLGLATRAQIAAWAAVRAPVQTVAS
jgi:DNA-binding CsgD family transcriptional regulator/tetratricopeptide (TPR) repeat protein